jgi:beta-lactam-binding protein with PASTA domain
VCIVPDVVGMRFDVARDSVRQAGCSTGPTKWVRSAEPGRVITQSPAAGTKVRWGEPVDLTVGRR